MPHPIAIGPERAAWLKKRYLEEGATLEEIAVECSCSLAAVFRAMRKYGISSRSPAQSREKRGTVQSSKFELLDDAVWLKSKYVDECLSLEEIGGIVGCSHVTVLKAIRRFGIPRRQPGLIRPGRVRPDVIRELRDEAWLREHYIDQGKSTIEIANMLNCSALTVATALSDRNVHRRPPRTEEEMRERTRTIKRKGGYVLVWAPDHPAVSQRGYVPQHRLVAEKELGRYLLPAEVVHHLNEKPDDNRPENLLVLPNNGAHMAFHANPPAWVPRCKCCNKPNPEILEKRPDDVPMLYSP